MKNRYNKLNIIVLLVSCVSGTFFATEPPGYSDYPSGQQSLQDQIYVRLNVKVELAAQEQNMLLQAVGSPLAREMKNNKHLFYSGTTQTWNYGLGYSSLPAKTYHISLVDGIKVPMSKVDELKQLLGTIANAYKGQSVTFNIDNLIKLFGQQKEFIVASVTSSQELTQLVAMIESALKAQNIQYDEYPFFQPHISLGKIVIKDAEQLLGSGINVSQNIKNLLVQKSKLMQRMGAVNVGSFVLSTRASQDGASLVLESFDISGQQEVRQQPQPRTQTQRPQDQFRQRRQPQSQPKPQPRREWTQRPESEKPAQSRTRATRTESPSPQLRPSVGLSQEDRNMLNRTLNFLKTKPNLGRVVAPEVERNRDQWERIIDKSQTDKLVQALRDLDIDTAKAIVQGALG